MPRCVSVGDAFFLITCSLKFLNVCIKHCCKMLSQAVADSSAEVEQSHHVHTAFRWTVRKYLMCLFLLIFTTTFSSAHCVKAHLVFIYLFVSLFIIFLNGL